MLSEATLGNERFVSKSLHDFSTVFSFLSIFTYIYYYFFSCFLCSVLLGLKVRFTVKDAATRCQVYMFQSARYLWFGYPCVWIRFLLHLCASQEARRSQVGNRWLVSSIHLI